MFLMCLLFQLFEKPLIYPIPLIHPMTYRCLIHCWYIYPFYFEMLVVCLFRLWLQLYFPLAMSDGFLHHIRFFFHINNPLFNHIVCSRDQWIFGRHDPGSWYFLIGFLQNQTNSIGSFQFIYSLCPQQSVKRNESPVI